jgi:hypothetical protein
LPVVRRDYRQALEIQPDSEVKMLLRVFEENAKHDQRSSDLDYWKKWK